MSVESEGYPSEEEQQAAAQFNQSTEQGSPASPDEAEAANGESAEQAEALKPQEAAEAFVADLEQIAPDGESLDLSHVDTAHLNALPENQRLDYVVEQVIAAEPATEDRNSRADQLRGFFTKHQQTVGRLSSLAAVLGGLAVTGTILKQSAAKAEQARTAVSQAMDEGRLQVDGNHRLTMTDQRSVARWMEKHPGAMMHVTVQNEIHEDVNGAGSHVTIQVTENGQTRTLEGNGDVGGSDAEVALDETLHTITGTEHEPADKSAFAIKASEVIAQNAAFKEALNSDAGQ